MRLSVAVPGLVVAVLAAPCPASAQAALEPGPARRSAPSFLGAAGGVLAANAVVWGVNRYLKDEPSARVGIRSWRTNLGAGFSWDADDFLNNQLGHPYHGGSYFTAARVNGYGYWTAVPFAAAGSLLWEIMGETTSPSINDLVNTTMGGVTLGEIHHRISGHLLRRHGSAAQGAGAFRHDLAAGYLRQGGDGGNSVQAFLAFVAEAGSPFDETARRPFDAYRFELEVTAGDPAVVTGVRASGLLGRRFLRTTRRSHLVLGVFQEYDYVNLAAHETGSQSLSAGLLYRRALGAVTELRAGIQARGVVLGAISSEHAGRAGRDYDYGPGLGSTVSISLRRGGASIRLAHTSFRLWNLSGADATHRAGVTRAGLRLPVGGGVGIGADLTLWGRTSRYHQAATTRQASHQLSRLRIYASGTPMIP
ncbi:MAG TPA: DUF3943 domain-containing protein [Gemmatimonadales bacterium]|nr:DUF3943 domain-containing protein [Gemmatimonadales bacterium]